MEEYSLEEERKECCAEEEEMEGAALFRNERGMRLLQMGMEEDLFAAVSNEPMICLCDGIVNMAGVLSGEEDGGWRMEDGMNEESKITKEETRQRKTERTFPLFRLNFLTDSEPCGKTRNATATKV